MRHVTKNIKQRVKYLFYVCMYVYIKHLNVRQHYWNRIIPDLCKVYLII
jgi:hypothetical protein